MVTLHGLLDGSKDGAAVFIEHLNSYAITEVHELCRGASALNRFMHTFLYYAGETMGAVIIGNCSRSDDSARAEVSCLGGVADQRWKIKADIVTGPPN